MTSKFKQKTIPVRVSTMDAELSFSISSKTTGQELFDLVCRTIGLRETWYFGLQYSDNKGFINWLCPKKKIVEQDLPQSFPVQLMFLVKFYPEKIEDLIQDITQHLFFLQVKQSIINMDIECSAEAAVLLASYAIQAHFGDFDRTVYKLGAVFAPEDLLPKRVLEQYNMTPAMWEERIVIYWRDHVGFPREDAELHYLKLAQDLEMYGINYFQIRDRKNIDHWLGVDAHGIHLYDIDKKLTPTYSFGWNSIQTVTISDKKFTVKFVEKIDDMKEYVFFTSKLKINNLIWELCKGNHELYDQRRKPESMEIQQMKTHANEEKARRLQQLEFDKKSRDRILEEKRDLEQKLTLLQQRLAQMEEEISTAYDALSRSEETVELLGDKNRQYEQEISLLNSKSKEALSLVEKIQQENILLRIKVANGERLAIGIFEECEQRGQLIEKLRQENDKLRKNSEAERQRRLQSDPSLLSPLPPFETPLTDNLTLEMEREREDYIQKNMIYQPLVPPQLLHNDSHDAK
ncbi:DgyrCDS10903 [Dimorphilus gyrociliatus]|uniref:DgyrCDS10903 n=1 Tax=Dimorphilus gyrociliatus TaxID=2664684 RepID=A0A7I8W339_9ANNE|nr:DgyrCDS10903 [Dimorphilus gyrociliatus]